MKIRIKFTKEESCKYLGHLDIMRFFQRCFNRAGVKMLYSEGFNPHQKMSFALPLGLGITSEGEYLDCEIADGQDLDMVRENLNKVSGDGFKILDVKKIKDGASKVMAAVRFAKYVVTYDLEPIGDDVLNGAVNELLSKKSIIVNKKTKNKEESVNIRGQIVDIFVKNNYIYMTLCAGSNNNLKAELVAYEIFKLLKFDLQRENFIIKRIDLFADDMISINDFETI